MSFDVQDDAKQTEARMNRQRDAKMKLRCPECPYKTRSERAFTEHLIYDHAVRPHQVPAIVARASNNIAEANGAKQ